MSPIDYSPGPNRLNVLDYSEWFSTGQWTPKPIPVPQQVGSEGYTEWYSSDQATLRATLLRKEDERLKIVYLLTL